MSVCEKYSNVSLISSHALNNYGRVVIATRLLLQREATTSYEYVGYAPYWSGFATKRPVL
jgi:hypothetical protein